MTTVKLTPIEFDFLLKYLPAYGSLNDYDANIYLQVLAKKKATHISMFWVENDANIHYRVAYIKMLRTLGGYSLKEAKDLSDASAKMDMAQLKVTKEQVIALAESHNIPRSLLTFG